jgi:Ubiquitin carboxyl-terminal hydrolase, family 1
MLAVGTCYLRAGESDRSIHRRLPRRVPHAFTFPNQYFYQLTHTCLLHFFSPTDKTPLERAEFLESTELFADIHAVVATSGQTAVPADLDTDLHFTCFVQAPESSAREAEEVTTKRRLIELDGGRAGPVDRGGSVDLLKVRSSLLDTLCSFRDECVDDSYVCVFLGRGKVC